MSWWNNLFICNKFPFSASLAKLAIGCQFSIHKGSLWKQPTLGMTVYILSSAPTVRQVWTSELQCWQACDKVVDLYLRNPFNIYWSIDLLLILLQRKWIELRANNEKPTYITYVWGIIDINTFWMHNHNIDRSLI